MSERRSEGEDRRLLGELLIEAGLVTREGLVAGLEEQRLRGGRLGYNLLKLGRVTPASLHLFLRDNFEVLSPELMQALRTSPAVDLIPSRLAHFYGMVPLRVEDGVLSLAMASADTPRLIPAVEELTGLRVDPLICPPALIADALASFYPQEIEAGVVHRAVGDNLFVLSDRKRGIRPMLPEAVREDAPAADWLRAIGAEAVRRTARRVRIDPLPGEIRVTFRGADRDDPRMSLPRGAYPGVAALLEGISRLSGRGRVVPREGRFVLTIDGRRLAASVLALPGFEGDSYTLDLSDERVERPSAEDLARDLPGLPPALDRLAASRRGLLVLAGPGEPEEAAGLRALAALLGERLARRAAVGPRCSVPGFDGAGPAGDEEEASLASRLERSLVGAPDLLLMPEMGLPGSAAAAFTQARERVVLAPVRAADCFAAVEWMARAGLGTSAEEAVAGVLGIRLMERLCGACRRPCDLRDLFPPGPRHTWPAGSYHAGQGCEACRGSGQLHLEPVFEFLPVSSEVGLFRPGVLAGSLRRQREREGMTTLVQAALRKASAGVVDVREPLRLLLHEQR
jgi:type IV pilus assembly protein PilB